MSKYRWVRRATYSVRDRAAHARNHNNTTPITKPNHLLCSRLRRHKSACNINLKHGVRVLCCIFQCRRLLLDASGGDKAIQTTVLGGNLLDNGIEMLNLADVNATVVQFRAELRGGALLDASKVFAGFGWGEGLDGRTGYGIRRRIFSQSLSNAYTAPDVSRHVSWGCWEGEKLPVAPASSRASACVSPSPRPAPDTRMTLLAKLNDCKDLNGFCELVTPSTPFVAIIAGDIFLVVLDSTSARTLELSGSIKEVERAGSGIIEFNCFEVEKGTL